MNLLVKALQFVGLPGAKVIEYVAGAHRHLSEEERANSAAIALDEKVLELRRDSKDTQKYSVDYEGCAIYSSNGDIYLALPKDETLGVDQVLEYKIRKVDLSKSDAAKSSNGKVVFEGMLSFGNKDVDYNKILNRKQKFEIKYRDDLTRERAESTKALQELREAYKASITDDEKAIFAQQASGKESLINAIRVNLLNCRNMADVSDAEALYLAKTALAGGRLGPLELEKLEVNSLFRNEILGHISPNLSKLEARDKAIAAGVGENRRKAAELAKGPVDFNEPLNFSMGAFTVSIVTGAASWLLPEGTAKKAASVATSAANWAVWGGLGIWAYNTFVTREIKGVEETVVDAGKGIADWVGTKASSLLPKHEAPAAALTH